MGVLDRMAMKREQKRLAPFFRADEHFVQTDVMDSVRVMWFNPRQRDDHGQAALTLTNRAIHVRFIKGHQGSAIRIPYEHVLRVDKYGQQFDVLTRNASWTFAFKGKPMGADNVDVIRSYLDRIENVNRTVNVNGVEVQAQHRPIEEDGKAAWLVSAQFGVDLSDPELRAAISEQFSEEVATYGGLFTSHHQE